MAGHAFLRRGRGSEAQVEIPLLGGELAQCAHGDDIGFHGNRTRAAFCPAGSRRRMTPMRLRPGIFMEGDASRRDATTHFVRRPGNVRQRPMSPHSVGLRMTVLHSGGAHWCKCRTLAGGFVQTGESAETPALARGTRVLFRFACGATLDAGAKTGQPISGTAPHPCDSRRGSSFVQ